jgi:hypothetical protein
VTKLWRDFFFFVELTLCQSLARLPSLEQYVKQLSDARRRLHHITAAIAVITDRLKRLSERVVSS